MSERARIFVVEDDFDISRLLAVNLSAAFDVQVFSEALPALRAAAEHPPALFVLDILLPDVDGREVCRRIRGNPAMANVGIIVLTALGSESDRVVALELGADDYMSKPFSCRELTARIGAILRRRQCIPMPPAITSGEIVIDPSSMKVTARGREVGVTTAEFRLLKHFMEHVSVVLTREQLLDAIWEAGRHVTPRTVDVHIRRLRMKIERDPDNPDYLQTVRGVGYRWVAPDVMPKVS